LLLAEIEAKCESISVGGYLLSGELSFSIDELKLLLISHINVSNGCDFNPENFEIFVNEEGKVVLKYGKKN